MSRLPDSMQNKACVLPHFEHLLRSIQDEPPLIRLRLTRATTPRPTLPYPDDEQAERAEHNVEMPPPRNYIPRPPAPPSAPRPTPSQPARSISQAPAPTAIQPTFVRHDSRGREVRIGSPSPQHPPQHHPQTRVHPATRPQPTPAPPPTAPPNQVPTGRVNRTRNFAPHQPYFYNFMSTGAQLNYVNRVRGMTREERLDYDRRVGARFQTNVARQQKGLEERRGRGESPGVSDDILD